jgi:hypothetical protein
MGCPIFACTPEPKHNTRFVALMDQFMPNWRLCLDHHNQLPVRHEQWEY